MFCFQVSPVVPFFLAPCDGPAMAVRVTVRNAVSGDILLESAFDRLTKLLGRYLEPRLVNLWLTRVVPYPSVGWVCQSEGIELTFTKAKGSFFSSLEVGSISPPVAFQDRDPAETSHCPARREDGVFQRATLVGCVLPGR